MSSSPLLVGGLISVLSLGWNENRQTVDSLSHMVGHSWYTVCWYQEQQCTSHVVMTVMTVELMFLHRVLQQLCSCRSAGGSTPSSLQELSRVRSLEP